MAKEFLYLDTSDLPYEFSLSDAKRLAYEQYGSREAWHRFARNSVARVTIPKSDGKFAHNVLRRRSEIDQWIARCIRYIKIRDEESITLSIKSLKVSPAFKKYVYMGIISGPYSSFYEIVKDMLAQEMSRLEKIVRAERKCLIP